MIIPHGNNIAENKPVVAASGTRTMHCSHLTLHEVLGLGAAHLKLFPASERQKRGV